MPARRIQFRQQLALRHAVAFLHQDAADPVIAVEGELRLANVDRAIGDRRGCSRRRRRNRHQAAIPLPASKASRGRIIHFRGRRSRAADGGAGATAPGRSASRGRVGRSSIESVPLGRARTWLCERHTADRTWNGAVPEAKSSIAQALRPGLHDDVNL